mmetsp:Transcript_17394/g.45419  ORF Transcript_17394/g.45419 Transcript_17394/m.45419 type:complete len:1392 (-) Transcript_17394:111-4286(-)
MASLTSGPEGLTRSKQQPMAEPMALEGISLEPAPAGNPVVAPVPQHPVDLKDLGSSLDPLTDPAVAVTPKGGAAAVKDEESWGLSDLWDTDAAPTTPLSIKRRSSVAGWESEPSVFDDADFGINLASEFAAAKATTPRTSPPLGGGVGGAATPTATTSTYGVGAGVADTTAPVSHVSVHTHYHHRAVPGPGRPSNKVRMWDSAAPADARVPVRKPDKAHGGTIIEQLIAAANRDGAAATQHDTRATVDDEDAIELLESIEKHMHPDYFPMKYQITFLDFFLQHHDHGGINGDDMGLGKTYSVWLCVLHDNPPRRGTSKTLLIANNQAVMNQWLKELNKFFINIPDWYTTVWCSDERWSATNLQRFKDAQVILTTKDTVVSDFMSYSPYWMTDRSMNRDGTSHVMYAPIDGEPRPGQIDRKSGDELDRNLISRRTEGRNKGRVSPLYARKEGHAVFDLIFVDEGDLLRVEAEHTGPGLVKKRSWQAVWNLHCDRTWIMTGTPVNNNATGLLSLFELCRCGQSLPARVQGLWTKDGSRPLTFMEQVRRLNWYQGNKAMLEAIRVLQKKDMMRRTIDMAEVQTQNAEYGRPLPLCKYVDVPVTVGRAEDVYFASVETNTTDALSSWLKLRGSDRFGSWQNVWEGMTRNRRVAALNPKMGITPSGTVDVSVFEAFPLSEKERAILDICLTAKRKGEQVVIATLFVECNVRLISVCEKFGLVADRFDGKMTQKQRAESILRFQSCNSDVMTMLMFAGGRGLNLQNANHLIITSPWWNPVVLDQTRRRVWRVGSKHSCVTMYNVFYDISVEQWMLQTRIRSKVMLAASLMNEEGIYGGEEAITTARSKKELSATLQETKQDEMWDFLSFLRAAPTARTEIRGVENIPWSPKMMSHPLIGPRCRRMMMAILLSSRRARRCGTVKELPISMWREIFTFMYCQDFPAVPEQKIETELPPEDQIELARQENQHNLEEVIKHIDECDGVLRAQRIAPDAVMVAQVQAKKQQLMIVRTALERVLQRAPAYRPPAAAPKPYYPVSTAVTTAAATAAPATGSSEAPPPFGGTTAAKPSPAASTALPPNADFSAIDPTYRPLPGETVESYVRRFGGWEHIAEEPRRVAMLMNRVAREAKQKEQAGTEATVPAAEGSSAAAAAPAPPSASPAVPSIHLQHPTAPYPAAVAPTPMHHPHHPQAPKPSEQYYVPATVPQWDHARPKAPSEPYRGLEAPLEESVDDVLFVDEDPMLVDDTGDTLIEDETESAAAADGVVSPDDFDLEPSADEPGGGGAAERPEGDLDVALAGRIVMMVQKYLRRRPMTMGRLSKKLKAVTKDADEMQQALGKYHLRSVLEEQANVRHINGEPHWELNDPSPGDDGDDDNLLPDSGGSSPSKHLHDNSDLF